MKRRQWARLSVAVVFLVNGAIFGTWASRIPAIAANLAMGPGTIAVAVFGLSCGAVLGLPLSGALVARFGAVPVVRVTLLGYAMTLVVVGVAGNVTLLTGALIGLGVGNGALDVAMNDAAVRVERHYSRQIMAAFHAMFSFGGLASALAGAAVAAAGISPDVHLPVAALVLLAVGLIASVRMLPEAPQQEEVTSARFSLPRLDPRLTALGLLVFSSLLCEGAVYDWSAIYIEDVLDAGAATAALGFAAFSLSMACGRLIADRFVHRLGSVSFVRSSGGFAVLAMGLVVVSPVPAGAVAGFGLLGLFLAGVVPTLFSGAAQGHREPAQAIAAVSTIGYLGFLAGPALIGGLATASGLRPALAALVALLVVVCAGAGALRQP